MRKTLEAFGRLYIGKKRASACEMALWSTCQTGGFPPDTSVSSYTKTIRRHSTRHYRATMLGRHSARHHRATMLDRHSARHYRATMLGRHSARHYRATMLDRHSARHCRATMLFHIQLDIIEQQC